MYISGYQQSVAINQRSARQWKSLRRK